MRPYKPRSSSSGVAQSARLPPFSKGTRVANPKRPGRKPGSGPFHYREAPLPEQITAPPVDVPVTWPRAPRVGALWKRSASTAPLRRISRRARARSDPVPGR